MKKDIKKILSLKELKNIFKKEKLQEYLHKTVNLKATPQKIAFSIALGIFIGLLIPMGLQTIFIIPLALATGSNLVLAYAATLISNPVTIIPIYYIAVKMGIYITNINFTWNNFSEVIDHPTYSNIIKLGGDGMLVFFSGAFMQALIISTFFYIISLKVIIYLRKRNYIFSK